MFRKIAPMLALLALALPASAQADPPGTGWFHADCESSHLAQVDPIVNPGTTSSHLHEFFGNRNTNAFTTNGSLRAHPETSCQRDDEPTLADRTDSSAYWVPALVDDGVVVRATRLGAGYSIGDHSPATIEPFPANLKVISGSASGGPSEINGERVWQFSCPGGVATPGPLPVCQTNQLRMEIRFQDCWDGVNVDSPNHKSHMSYSDNQGNCDAAHPVPVPRLQLGFLYPTNGEGVVLSSGGANTAHADFMNGWRLGKQAQLVRACLNPDEYCGGTSSPVPGE